MSKIVLGSFLISLVTKGFDLVQDGLFARGADDPPGWVPLDETKDGGHGMNFVHEAQVEAVISVDFDRFDLTAPTLGNLLEDCIQNPAGPAPGSPKLNQDGLRAFQNFRGEICAGDSDRKRAFSSVHVFGFL